MHCLNLRFFPTIKTPLHAPRIAIFVLIVSGTCGCQEATPQREPGRGNTKTARRVELDEPAIRPSPPTDPLPRLVETIQSLGGKVALDETGITAIDWHRASINNLDLELLTEIPTLKRLYLSGTRIDSRGWAYLAALPNLERLALWRTPFTDEDLKYLSGAKHLKMLDLSECWMTGSGLSHLEPCHALETLLLKGAYLDEGSMRQLALLKSLRTLDIQETSINSGAQIAPLKDLPHLEELRMDFCDGEILRQMAGFPNIRRLDLTHRISLQVHEGYSAIGNMPKLESLKYRSLGKQDEFLGQIAKCQNLREIQVLGWGSRNRLAQFTEQGLARLAASRSLRWLDVREATASLQGLRALAQANPQLRILVQPIKLHGLQDAFRSIGLGAKHSREGGPRLVLDREMNIITLRLEDAKILLPSLKQIAQAIDPEKLQHLSLGHTGLTDEGLAAFRAGASLKHLNLKETNITSKGLKTWGGGDYPKLPLLETLDLSGTTLDDECLEWISTLPRIKSLRLANVQGVTDKGWQHLSRLQNRETLER